MPENLTIPNLDIPTIDTPFLSNDSIIALNIDTQNRYDKVFSGGSNPMPYPMPRYEPSIGSPSQQQILNNSFSKGTLGQALLSPDRRVRNFASESIRYQNSLNNPARYNIGVPVSIQYDPAMDKYINGKYGYNPRLGIQGNEELYYQDYLSQNAFSRTLTNVGVGLGRFATGILAKTVGTFGYLGSMIGNGIQEMFDSSGNNAMADIANNSLSRWAEVNWEENWKNSQALSVFKPSDWEDRGFWSKMFEAPFWTDEVADGAAFMGEMILSTYLTGGIGKLVGLGKLGATGINTASKLGKYGSTLGKIGKGIDYTLKFATGADDVAGIGRWAFLTTSESAVESSGRYREAKDDLYRKRDQGIEGFANMTDYQIEQEAGDVAASSFKGNMMVLAASNAFENRFIFNKIFKKTKADEGDMAVVGRSRPKNIEIATGGKTVDEIGKASMKQFKYTTKLGKVFDWKNGLSASRFYGWMGLRAVGAEGLWEENAQLAIERLSSSEHYRRMNPVGQFSTIVGQSGTQAYNAIFGDDKKASTAIGLGAIIGIGGGGLTTKIFGGEKLFRGERRQTILDTQKAIDRYEAARGKMFSFNNIWKKDDKGKFIRENGQLVIDEGAAAAVLESLYNSTDHLSRIDEIENPTLRQHMMDNLMVDFVFAAKKAGIFDRSIESINRIKDYTEEEAIELGFDPASMADHTKVIDTLNSTGKIYDSVYNNVRNKTYTDKQDLTDEENRKYYSFREKAQSESIKRTIEGLTAEEDDFIIKNLDFTNPERSRSDLREINTLRLQLFRLEQFEKEALSSLKNDLFKDHIKLQKEKIKKELDRLEPLYEEDIKNGRLKNIKTDSIEILYTTEEESDQILNDLYIRNLVFGINKISSLRNSLEQSKYLDSLIDVSNDKSLENFRRLKDFRNEINELTNLVFLEERIAVIKKSIDELKAKPTLTEQEQKDLAGFEQQLKDVEEVYKKAVEKQERKERGEQPTQKPEEQPTTEETPPPPTETEEEKKKREEAKTKEEENIDNIINLLSSISTDDTDDQILTNTTQLKSLFEKVKNYNLVTQKIKELLDQDFNQNQINIIYDSLIELADEGKIDEQNYDELLTYLQNKETPTEIVEKSSITETTEGDYLIKNKEDIYTVYKEEPTLFYIKKEDGTLIPVPNEEVPDIVKKDLEEYIKGKELDINNELDNLEKRNTKPEEVQPAPTETTPISTKTEFKREDFPEVQERVDTPITQKLLDYFADVVGIPRWTEGLSGGKYYTWLNNHYNETGNPLGPEITRMLNAPRQVFDKITEYKEAQEKTPAPVSIDAKADIEKTLYGTISGSIPLSQALPNGVYTDLGGGLFAYADKNERIAAIVDRVNGYIVSKSFWNEKQNKWQLPNEANLRDDAKKLGVDETTYIKKYQDAVNALNALEGGVKPTEEQAIIGEQIGDFIVREQDGKWKIYNKNGESLGLSYNTKEEAIDEINKSERAKTVYDELLDKNIQELKSLSPEERDEKLESIARAINLVKELDGKLQYDPNAQEEANRIAALYHPRIINLANSKFPKYKQIVQKYEEDLLKKESDPINDEVFEQFRNGSVDQSVLQSIAKKDLENPDSLSNREKIIRDSRQKEIADIKKQLLKTDDIKVVPKENTAADYQNQENFVDNHSDEMKAQGLFSFVSSGPQEVMMKGDKPVIIDNVVQTEAGTGQRKEVYRRYRNVIEKHGPDFTTEIDGKRKFRLKLLTVNDNNRPWFLMTSKATSIIAVITDGDGRILSFDEQGNINTKGTPLAFEFSMAEYSSRADKNAIPNILKKRSSVILGGDERVKTKVPGIPFFEELWQKKVNEATVNNQAEIDFDPTGDIVNLLKSGIEIFADFDVVLNSKLSSSRVNNKYSVAADSNFEAEAKTLQELMELGFLDENAFPIIESDSIGYFDDSAGQNVKKGAPYFPVPGSKLKIPLFGKKIKDLTIGGERIYSSETGELYAFGKVIKFIQDNNFLVKDDKTSDKVYRIPKSEFLQRSGTAEGVFREMTDEEFNNVYEFIRGLFYSEDIEVVLDNQEMIIRDKRSIKSPLSEYRINMNKVDFSLESQEFIFNDERFGDEYIYSYLGFVKENFITNSLPANIGEENGKPINNFVKLNKRVIFTLEYSYPEIEAKLKNTTATINQTPQEADPQTEETIKNADDIASEDKNGFGKAIDDITFEC